MAVGKEIRRRRKARGLSQEKLAERAKLSTTYISGIENNHRDPSLSTVVAICKALKIAPGELLGGMVGLTAAGIQAGKQFEKLSEDTQRLVLELMQQLEKRR